MPTCSLALRCLRGARPILAASSSSCSASMRIAFFIFHVWNDISGALHELLLSGSLMSFIYFRNDLVLRLTCAAWAVFSLFMFIFVFFFLINLSQVFLVAFSWLPSPYSPICFPSRVMAGQGVISESNLPVVSQQFSHPSPRPFTQPPARAHPHLQS